MMISEPEFIPMKHNIKLECLRTENENENAMK